MHKNPYWLAFLCIVGCVTAWYSVIAILAVQHYRSLSATTKLTDAHWSVDAVASDFYLPRVEYNYQLGNQIFKGRTILDQPAARNPEAAQKLANQLSKEQWTIWYDPSHPNRSSLQKSLPIKECLSAVTLLGVFAYLVWLGYSVGMARS